LWHQQLVGPSRAAGTGYGCSKTATSQAHTHTRGGTGRACNTRALPWQYTPGAVL
jgi:hypothetical protein